LTGEQLKKHLSDILGADFHYDTTPKGVKIYLANKSAAPVRHSDGAKVPHDIKGTDIKKVGLASYQRADNNLKTYNKRIEYLFLELSDAQLESFASIETVEPLDGV
jgi:hypothetical protein